MTARPEPTAHERETAIAAMNAHAGGIFPAVREELIATFAEALARHRVEVAERCAAVCETFAFAHGSDQCAAAVRHAGRSE